ncbi:MAG: radical SAM protein [Deltaproteobacteria bacterium]|nr:radical SAM protein [Deltaproteobacteria bacterium]
MFLNSVGMLLTFRCNAMCRHCCFEAGPERTDRMPIEDARRFVREVSRAGGRGVVFTGGEPFVEYETLRAVVAEAGRLGLRVRIVTNGLWAASERHARRLLRVLCQEGLKTLTVSYDEPHEACVPGERVRTAVAVALDLGLRVIVSSAILDGDLESAVSSLLERLDLPPHPSLWVKPGHVSPNGRALSSFDSSSFAGLDLSSGAKRLDGPCAFVVAEPVVTPAGDLAACCSPATATRTGFRPEFVVGNLHRTSLRRLQEDLETDPLFLFLMLRGPWALRQVAGESGVEPDTRTPIVNQCDLCAALLHDGAATRALREFLLPRRAELELQAIHLAASLGDRYDDYLEARAGLRRLVGAGSA